MRRCLPLAVSICLSLQTICLLLQVPDSASGNVATSNPDPSEENVADRPTFKPSIRYVNEKEKNRDRNDYTLRTNWTRTEIIDLIKSHGYASKESTDGTIYVLIGDILVHPYQILPEFGWHESRSNLAKNRRWLDKHGHAEVEYYFDTKNPANATLFQQAVKAWSDKTCIKFTKLDPNPCLTEHGHATVCVGDFGGCHSEVGKIYIYGQGSQRLSVAAACGLESATHEFGHTLGLAHEMSRPDRDEYIQVNFENIDIKLEDIHFLGKIYSGWGQASKCSPKAMYDAPKPYDSMSLMQYAAGDFAEEDQRPIYVNLNAKYQYMFDYHRPAGFLQSHYDYYLINVGYQCGKRWKADCQKNGKGAPNCKNYGYLTKNCKCACAAGFSGSTCSSKSGPMFPLQDRAKAQVDVSEPGVVNMAGKGMKDGGNYIASGFVKRQYIGVFIKSGEGTRISVLVTQDFSKISDIFKPYQDDWIKHCASMDCMSGITMFVGDFKTGFVRSECFSSVLNIELPSDSRVLTSKNNTLDIVGLGNNALCPTGHPEEVRKSMEFKFTVSFLEKPEDILTIEKKYPGKFGAMLGEGARMLGRQLKKNLPAIIGGGVALLLIIGGIIGFVMFRKHHNGDGDSKGGAESLKNTDSGSHSDSPSSGSDSNDYQCRTQ